MDPHAIAFLYCIVITHALACLRLSSLSETMDVIEFFLDFMYGIFHVVNMFGTWYDVVKIGTVKPLMEYFWCELEILSYLFDVYVLIVGFRFS